GVVIAAVATGGAESCEQLLVGDGVEEITDGDQGEAIVQTAPGEQWLCGVDVHGKTSGESTHRRYQRKGSPRKVSSGGKIVKREPTACSQPEKTRSRWGKAFPSHSEGPRKNGSCRHRIRLDKMRSLLQNDFLFTKMEGVCCKLRCVA